MHETFQIREIICGESKNTVCILNKLFLHVILYMATSCVVGVALVLLLRFNGDCRATGPGI